MPLVLGVDSSTQSTEMKVRDVDDGAVVAAAQAPHPRTTPPRSEQDPESWWSALREALHSAAAPRVDAISISGQQHGMVVLDRAGRVLRPAKLWNDTESAQEAAELVDALGPERWAEATGSVPVAAFTITKLAWLARHEPDALASTATVLLPHDFLTYRLTGSHTTDRGDASGTGYFDPRSGEWLCDLLARFVDDRPWLDHLPRVATPFEAVGEVRARAAEELRLGAGVVVAAGTGDNMAAALGAGLGPDEAAVSLGTSGTVYATSATPTADATGAVAGFADATGRYLPLVCTLNATKVTAMFARLLGVGEQELGEIALGAPAGAAGTVVVPYVDGERTPNRPDATGMLAGLRSGTTREQVARAAHEGVVCGLLDGLDALMAATGQSPSRLVLTGGGARSPASRQILADLSGLEVTVLDNPEQVATGACIQAAAALTGVDHATLATSWGVRAGTVTRACDDIDRGAVRDRYREARDAIVVAPRK